jgi:hypothetical protein
MANEEEQADKAVPLKRKYPEDLESNFVSNIVVQHQPDHFILSFFEVWPPPILGDTEEERQRAMESIEEVEAKCVARWVVTPGRMREFIEIMSQNWEKFQGKLAELQAALVTVHLVGRVNPPLVG